ncbi:TonB-dependent receptor domain-containing protein [Roseinatronobacter sp. S2]|uniref:TonB-dependent receptor domain-containing protein n=1 Tax=Roseinatronobacter sp. S2 TaxID=3035471 RepID=UPI00240FC582|nr:TonB-dependent receptor [Roseinatronobacter sp. S2]WFE76470.1 TonB-dependent receptor [Roseinatronobacter sp. S2]
MPTRNQGNYKTGEGSELPDGPNGRASTNSPRGGLAKIDIVPNNRHALKFGLRTYDNTFQNSSYEWDVRNRTWTADYHFTPDSPLIDLTVAAYYNDTNLNYPDATGSYAGRRTQEESYGVSITNRAQVPLASGSTVRLEYGLSWDRDDFQTHAMRGGNHPGKLDKASAFGEAEIDFDRFSLRGGLRYDYWRINGYRPPFAAGVADCPAGGAACGDEWAHRDGGRLLPKVGASYQVSPELTVHASYSHTLRPPTTHEAFFALVPFGDGVGSGMTNNLNLKPEFSRNLEFGVDYHGRNLWQPGDEATLRVSVFRNRIRDFIVNDFVDIPGVGFPRAMWINRDGTTTMKGVEVEGGYDSGAFYANFGVALSKTDDQPLGDGAGAGNGEGSALPKRTATLDIGVRPLDERLTLGAQVRYVGESAQAAYDWSQFPAGSYWSRSDPYTLVGLYGSYDISDVAQAFFTVENLFDKVYGYPGGSSEGYQAMTGRGRTFTGGLSMRF